MIQDRFYALADVIRSKLSGDEIFMAWLSGEETDFVRFNRNLVRQASSVTQANLSLSLISKRRRAEMTMTLSWDMERDEAGVSLMLEKLRGQLQVLPEDPYLLYSTEVQSTEFVGPSEIPPAEAVVDEVMKLGSALDLVGVYASGPMVRGFANSLGQRNWHSSSSYNLEWCLYHAKDKAVKNGYAGSVWKTEELARSMASSKEQLQRLREPSKELKPGQYRAYLAPSAIGEVMSMLSWGGFGAKSQRTKQSCLQKMIEDNFSLHSSVSIAEHTRAGIACGFGPDGFLKDDRVSLIDDGKLTGSLVSPRSASELGLRTNGANRAETPDSLEMSSGMLKREEALSKLHTGLWIEHLWYLNFSDRLACRMTGMTRFASFWVENGRIQSPLAVMRFDDSVFRMLGSELESLTEHREFLPNSDSYGERSTQSMRLPGALVRGLAITL